MTAAASSSGGQPSGTHRAPVVVVGAGISGLTCARVLTEAGVPVRVLDRGRRPGGRMSGRRVETTAGVRVVDLGASYFTASSDEFTAQVADWQSRGLARPWTDRFEVIDGNPDEAAREPQRTSSGPVRYGAAGGLRSLVDDLVAPPGRPALVVETETDVESVDATADGPQVDGVAAAAVVLAMPDPQAADLLPRMVAMRLDVSARWNYRPCIAVYAAWEERWWPEFHGAFVNSSDLLVFLADDGDRRGDRAPVLVAHAAPDFSAEHLDDPASAVAPVIAELGPLLTGAPTPVPVWNRAHRWSLAEPLRQHEDSPFGLDEGSLIGVCGDAWGPSPKVEAAWTSGRRLGLELLERLG